jgi:hypothetical protein
METPRETPENAAEFADYAASLTADLAVLARSYGLQTLADLLDMARLEAENAAGHRKPKAN